MLWKYLSLTFLSTVNSILPRITASPLVNHLKKDKQAACDISRWWVKCLNATVSVWPHCRPFSGSRLRKSRIFWYWIGYSIVHLVALYYQAPRFGLRSVLPGTVNWPGFSSHPQNPALQLTRLNRADLQPPGPHLQHLQVAQRRQFEERQPLIERRRLPMCGQPAQGRQELVEAAARCWVRVHYFKFVFLEHGSEFGYLELDCYLRGHMLALSAVGFVANWLVWQDSTRMNLRVWKSIPSLFSSSV